METQRTGILRVPLKILFLPVAWTVLCHLQQAILRVYVLKMLQSMHILKCYHYISSALTMSVQTTGVGDGPDFAIDTKLL